MKLTYFDFPGGRGEVARLAFHLGKVDFDDHRFAFPEFAEVKKQTPLAQVPTLTVDDEIICQSNAINRYVGQLTGLYPKDFKQALYCDEIMDGVEDVLSALVRTFPMQTDEMQTAREALVAGPITTYLKWLESRLQAHGGEYFADNRLTIADLKVWIWVNALNSGNLDHIPTDLVANVAPMLNQHAQRIAVIPEIAAYYS